MNRMDQERFKKEIIPLRGQLLAVAGRMLGDPDEAEDAVQETFLKLWTIRGRLGEVDNVPALSVQVTKNACLNRIKVLKRHTGNATVNTPVADSADPYIRLERQDAVDRTMRIIDRLPDLQQAILRMRHVDGLEVEEIAALTGSNPEAVRMNLSRARRRVKELFMKGEK